MKDVAALHAAWAEIALRYDPLADDPQAIALLHNPADHQAMIADAIANMQVADEISGGGILKMGYRSCLSPALWRRGGEAVMQARLFQILSLWYREHPEDAPALDTTLVRGTFFAGYQLATPHCALYDGTHFLVIPFVYTEFLMLSARAFTQALTPDASPGSWGALAGGQAGLATTPPPAFRHLIARILTSDRFDPLDEGDNPVHLLVQRGGWFASASENGDATPLEFALSYCALDFALAHEMGHRVAGHLIRDSVDALLEEVEADDIGLRLYATSQDWRDELLDDSPLGRDARILLGPLWFFHSASLLLSIKSLLGERLQRIEPAANLVRTMLKERAHLTPIAVRWQAQVERLKAWRAVVGTATIGGNPDGVMLAALAQACEDFAIRTVTWISEISDADLLAAARA